MRLKGSIQRTVGVQIPGPATAGAHRAVLPTTLVLLLSTAAIVGEFAVCPARAEPLRSPLEHIEPDPESGTSAAVVVRGRDLVHTTQLLPTGQEGEVDSKPDAQIDRVVTQLKTVLEASNADPKDLVKVNLYAKDRSALEQVKAKLGEMLPDAKPAIAFVVTDLPHPQAVVALDAVAAASSEVGQVQRIHVPSTSGKQRLAEAAVLPQGDVVYISGQAERTDSLDEATRGTLDGLLRTLRHLELDRSQVVQVKCFMKPMTEVETVEEEIVRFFGEQLVAPLSYVEWESSLPIEIELVAFAPPKSADSTVTYLTPPWMNSSPVFSRIARIHGPAQIYASGLVGDSDGEAAEQIQDIFASLERIAEKAGSDLRHLAKATYYVSTDEASDQLNELRPNYYDPERPPAASKAMIRGTGVPERSITLDMIAAPRD